MLKGGMRMVAGLAACALLAMLVAGCVRAKPQREREPLPTLPVEAAEEVAPPEGEALVLAEIGEPTAAEEAEETVAMALTEQEEAEGAESEAEEPAVEQAVEQEEGATEAAPAEPPTATQVTVAPTPELPPYDGPLYVVAPGDTLASIAALHGSTVQAFMEANGLIDSAAIVVGQELRLPPGAAQYDPEQLATYIVRPGDTLDQIAAWHRMPVEQLRALNPQITNPSLLRVGQEITVLIQPIPEGATVHVVQPNETLASIALRYGVSVYDLAQANHIRDANRLDVGQQLVIPE